MTHFNIKHYVSVIVMITFFCFVNIVYMSEIIYMSK